jgi:hypothetical protein
VDLLVPGSFEAFPTCLSLNVTPFESGLDESYTSVTWPTWTSGPGSPFGWEVVSSAYAVNGDLETKTQAGVTWTYAYNEMGLLKEVKEGSTVRATYAYDGLGRRVKATETGVTTFFVYGLGLDPLWEKTGTTETRHVYANGLRTTRGSVSP